MDDLLELGVALIGIGLVLCFVTEFEKWRLRKIRRNRIINGTLTEPGKEKV